MDNIIETILGHLEISKIPLSQEELEALGFDLSMLEADAELGRAVKWYANKALQCPPVHGSEDWSITFPCDLDTVVKAYREDVKYEDKSDVGN